MGFANSILQTMRDLLVIKPSSLGDIVHALRVVASIKEDCPETRIYWVARDLFAPITRASGLVESVFEFRRGAGLLAYLRLLKEIRSRRFDQALEMQGLLRSALMAFSAKAGQKWGRHDGREGAPLFYAKVAPPRNGPETHAIEVLLAFKEALGLKPELTGKLRFPKSKLTTQNKDLLDQVTAGGKLPLITLFPESRRPEKEWPRYLELARKLRDSGQAAVAVASVLADKENDWQGMAHLGGKTELAELPALIEASAVIVTNDSAPLHLASALERPLVGLFGPTNPVRFGPYPVDSPHAKSIRAPQNDLAQLTVEAVQNEILSLLGEV